MKLYTEQQVREAYNEGCWNGFNEIKDAEDYTINLLIPIELPTDEEIEQTALDFAKKYRATTYEISALIIGAKYVIDKIKGGTK